jgi:transcriptional regulator with XRE-family HTH domain
MRESGLGAGTISKLENDQTNRTQATTQSLADAFGLTVAALESGYARFAGRTPAGYAHAAHHGQGAGPARRGNG